MAEELFRKDAVDHLVSTEELDQAPRLISFQGWTLVTITVLLVATALAMGFLVRVPVAIEGQGIIWSPIGVSEFMVNTSGNVTSLLLGQGQTVEKGQVIAVIDQSDLEIELAALRADHEGTLKYIKALENLQQEDRTLREGHQKVLNTLAEASNDRYTRRRARLKIQRDQLEFLRKKGHVPEDRYSQAIEKFEDTDERLAALDREQAQLSREDSLSDLQLRKEILTQKNQALQIVSKIESMETRILEKGQITAPFGGRVVQLNVAVGDFLTPGQSIATIEPLMREGGLQALIFASNLEGKLIKPGMRVEMDLTAYPKDMYGKLIGEVIGVSTLPSSSQGMMRALKNDLLVKFMSEQGAPFELQVLIQPDPSDGSGYHWSSGSAETRFIKDGMLCSAQIISRTRRLVDLFLPQTF